MSKFESAWNLLSVKEKNELCKNVSASHKSNDRMNKLFGYLREKGFQTHRTIIKDQLFQFVFSEKFQSTKYRLLLRDGLDLIKDFVVAKQAIANKDVHKWLWLNRAANHSALYEKEYNALLKKPFNTTDQFVFELLQSQDHFGFETRYIGREASSRLDDILLKSKQLHWYVHLKYGCELINRKNVTGQEIDLTKIQKVVNSIEGEKNELPGAILIYYDIFRMLETEEPVHYEKARLSVQQSIKAFEPEHVSQFFVFLINFCIRQTNLGKEFYRRELFEIYQLAFTHDLLQEGNYLNLFHFKNMATLSFLMKEYKLAKTFTERYADRLEPIYRESARAYNLARYYFYLHDEKKALHTLQKVDYADVYYEMGSRTLLLKVYYELSEFDFLDAQIHSFRMFLKRNKEISSYQRNMYLNFIKWIKRISEAGLTPKKLKKETWRKEIQTQAELVDRQWLLEKLNEMG